jgi:hypothetical protein
MRRLLLALPLLWLSGCALNESGVCPESKGLRCVAGTDCSNDSSRGCRVCQCSSALSPSPPPYNPMHDPASTGRVTDPSQPIR